MELTIISPERVLYQGIVTSVQVPGKSGRFEVLENHAPIISSLTEGSVIYHNEQENSQKIRAGFIEVANNNVTICAEL